MMEQEVDLHGSVIVILMVYIIFFCIIAAPSLLCSFFLFSWVFPLKRVTAALLVRAIDQISQEKYGVK